MDQTLIISIAAFLGVAALIGAAAFLLRDFQGTTAEERLEALTGSRTGESRKAAKEELLRESMDGMTGALNNWINRYGNINLLFEQADSPIKLDGFLVLTAVCAVVGVVVSMVAGSPPPLYPLGALIGGALPLTWLLLRRRRRLKIFGQQLPDALELIGRALRSGHSLASGLHLVVEEMPAPISTEFGLAYEEQNLGVPIEDALKDMLRRIPSMDLRFFVTAVSIQRQAGGDLAEILDKLGYIIRERFKIMGQVQALTGEGRISGVVLLALPIALFFAVYYLNEDYVMLLFEEELGRKMIAFAAVMQIFGAVAIKKIIAIKI